MPRTIATVADIDDALTRLRTEQLDCDPARREALRRTIDGLLDVRYAKRGA